jgi:nitrilase
MVAFGEALVPGYPFWPELTDGARFESATQKKFFALYARQAVDVAGGGLQALCRLAGQRRIAVYLGCIERATDRSAHSLYASLVYIGRGGEVGSVHRKLCPTHEERLVWSPGDGHGLRVHALDEFRVGGLNCWENWMPLPRAALYAQGENVHVAAWPGSRRNTHDITRFLAREGRSWVISVSGLMHRDWIAAELPQAEALRAKAPEWLADGGSCVAGPDGQWLQNFDPAGHYSRPDVTRLIVDRKRQNTTRFED